jgi:hypothetical protein
MSIKKNDIKFGAKMENKKQPIIEKVLNCELTKLGKWDTFDYRNKQKKILVELKSRHIAYNTYSTTMIGNNKINKGLKLLKEGWNIYFYFNFVDGLYYYKLDETIKDCRIAEGGRCDRGHAEYKPYCYIPIEMLTKV